MAGSISQVDLTDDGSGPPDTFVQIRFPTGETPEGSVYFYQPVGGAGGGGAREVDLISADTVTFTGAESPAVSEGGFDYYNVAAPDNFFDGGPTNTFAVVYEDADGDNTNALIFGTDTGPPLNNVEFAGGPLGGDSVRQVINDPNVDVAGGGKQIGTGPFAISEDGGTVTQGPSDPNAPSCFATGTLIATPGGERLVETLQAGDLVLTADGRAVPVKWMGQQTMCTAGTSYAVMLPVRISAGALGENVPHTDLVVTGDHGVFVDGVMVNAAALVNGTTIVRVPKHELSGHVTYWHVETESHDMVVAAGVTAETFVDATTREKFDNYGEFVELFGAPSERMPVLPYPRVFSTRQLPQRVRERVAARAAALDVQAEASAA